MSMQRLPRHASAVAAIAAGLVACGSESRPAPQATSAAARQAPASQSPFFADAPSCPGKEFEAFLDAFAEQPELQPRHTLLPLPYSVVEDGPVEPVTRERQLPVDSVPWPVLPSARQRAAYGLRLELAIDTTRASFGQFHVTLARPNTDYQIAYTFVRVSAPEGSCWQLIRVANESL